MATNSNTVSLDVLFSFVDSLSAEKQAEIGDLADIDGGYQRALDAFHAAHGASPTEKKERAVREYRVLLLNEDEGTFEDLGIHAGSPGRAPAVPSKMSALQKCEQSANVRVLQGKRKGVTLSIVKTVMGED
jgi:hypothetical protein